ncbi:MAG: hypothetical protein ABSA47_16995 [Verrucomicrobiota bacterium]
MSNARKDEAEAVRTTIVGGRPPGSGRNNVPVPRGIEVLVKKASVDAGFRELLLKQRGKAAATIQLELDPAENAMLSAIPQEQLAQIVDQTTVPMELRSAFRGRVALVMLAALGVGLAASSPAQPIFGQPNQSNAIPPQAQPSNLPSYTGPPMTVAGALPLPDKTTTNVPPPNVEITNPPPPQQPLIVAGVMRRVPPTNAPATNMPLAQTVDTQPDRPVVVFGLRMTPPTNATPAEPPRTNPPSTNVISPPIRGLQPNVPVFGAMATPPTNASATNTPATNPPPANLPRIIAGLMVRPPTNPPPNELTATDPPSAKPPPAT